MDTGFDKQKYFVLNGILFGNILTYKGLTLCGGGLIIKTAPILLTLENSGQCQLTSEFI